MVVLVDDELLLLRVMGRVLEELGHRVMLFDNPRIAAESIPLEHVDAILVDLRMPHLSGVELARRLRQRDVERRTPIFLISGDPDDVREEDRSLFTSIHRKPMTRDELGRLLRRTGHRSSHTRLRVPRGPEADEDEAASGTD